MRKGFSERLIIAGLLGLLLVEVLALLLHLGVLPYFRANRAQGASLAGHISKAENQWRRRGLNSLVWENSAVEEPLYFHDSVLTLAQSTATLKLLSDSEIHLAENTLVTIEPDGDREHGEIRLKFVRGSVQARNPFGSTRVSAQEWSVQLQPGSEVGFRQTGETDFEVEVSKGSAVFTSASGERALGPAEMLRVANNQPATVTRDPGLRWHDGIPARVYTSGDTYPLEAAWDGFADNIVLQSLGAPETKVEVIGRNRRALELPVGNHRMYLRRGDSVTSAFKDIQVWKSPPFHLLQPLPRNRIPVGIPAHFVWSHVPRARGFEVIFRQPAGSARRKVESNELTGTFDREEDLEWGVEVIDQEGVSIPPPYFYPLFIREKPLAPPRLKQPTIRAPAAEKTTGAWLWNLLIPAAMAEGGSFEAVFEWEPVDGADHYVLEISESADFRKPALIKTLKASRFVWREFALKKHFWRVAAGNSRGKMGVFSEPEVVNLQDLASDPKQKSVDGIAVRRVDKPAAAVVAPEPKPDPVVAPAPAPTPEAEPEPERIAREFKTLVGWRPSFLNVDVRAESSVHAKMNGATLGGGVLEIPIRFKNERVWRLDVDYLSARFKPEPAATYPFQEDLRWKLFASRVTYFNPYKRWGLGLQVRQVLSFVRTDYEQISPDINLGVGPTIEGSWRSGRVEYRVQAGAVAVKGGGALSARPELRWHIYHVVIGAGMDAEYSLVNGGTGLLGQGFGLLAIEF